jgi:hypothetical protein
MDYLLTWNCTHIANATLRGRIEAVCRDSGVEPPAICTPEKLPGGEDDLIREVRAAREESCRQFEYDLGAIVRDLREQELVEGRTVVQRSPRRPSEVRLGSHGRDLRPSLNPTTSSPTG